MEITLDTHSLIWYLDIDLNKKLSKKALNTITKAEKEGIIYIPVIILVEVLYLIEKGRIDQDFSKLLEILEESSAYSVIPVNTSLLKLVEELKNLETHDRLIVATAKLTNSPLVSKDKVITNNYENVIW